MVLRCTSQVSLHQRHAWDKSHFAHLDSEGATFGGLLHSLQVLMNLDRHHTLLKREREPSANWLPCRGTWPFLSVWVPRTLRNPNTEMNPLQMKKKKNSAVLNVNSGRRNALFLFLFLKKNLHDSALISGICLNLASSTFEAAALLSSAVTLFYTCCKRVGGKTCLCCLGPLPALTQWVWTSKRKRSGLRIMPFMCHNNGSPKESVHISLYQCSDVCASHSIFDSKLTVFLQLSSYADTWIWRVTRQHHSSPWIKNDKYCKQLKDKLLYDCPSPTVWIFLPLSPLLYKNFTFFKKV